MIVYLMVFLLPIACASYGVFDIIISKKEPDEVFGEHILMGAVAIVLGALVGGSIII